MKYEKPELEVMGKAGELIEGTDPKSGSVIDAELADPSSAYDLDE